MGCNTARAFAAADSPYVGITPRKVLKVLKDPYLAVALFNAQLRMRRRASVPLSVRLKGRVHISGDGRLVFGNGITLIGNVLPIEFVSQKGACITIGDHTFINYGSSISAHKRVAIGRHCLLGHYTFILDNNGHDLAASHAAAVRAGCYRRSRLDRLARVRLARRPYWPSLRGWCG